MQGFISTVVDEKGFGFVTPDGEGADAFFHASDLLDAEFGPQIIQMRVRFDMVSTERGLRARRVQPAD